MMNLVTFIILCLFLSIGLAPQSAKANQPVVGKKAAQKYFAGEAGQKKATTSAYDDVQTIQSARRVGNVSSLSSDDHYLAMSVGFLTQSDAYLWGSETKQKDIGGMLFDLTYRLNQDSALFDEGMRISYGEYEPEGERAQKLSFLYTILLPDAGSRFPVYFGLAAGPGVFMRQISTESPVSLDYQLLLGLRLFNVFENTGFSIEGGLRNHLHVTSNGQLNGVFISAGAVFTF